MDTSETNADHPVLCQSVEDFFAPRTRAIIGRLLEDWLDLNVLIPIELLCSSSHQDTLEKTNFKLRNAVDRAAVQQAKLLDVSSSNRVDALYQLLGDLKSYIRTQASRTPDSPIKVGRFQEVVDLVHGSAGGLEAICQIGILLSTYLETEKWKDKVQRLADLFSKVRSPEALEFLDSVLGEVVGRGAIINDILDFPPAKKTLIHSLIGFLESEDRPSRNLPRTALALHQLLHEHSLVESRYNIEALIAQEIAGNSPLGDYGVVNRLDVDQVLGELRILRGFLGRLRAIDDLNNPAKLLQAFNIRTARLISSDTLRDLISGQTILDKTTTLLTMHGLAIGSAARRSIEELLLPMIDDERFVTKVSDTRTRPVDQIYSLGKLAVSFEDSHIIEIEPLLERLGKAQQTLLKNHNLLAKIDASDRSTAEKALQVLELCCRRVFVLGENRAIAFKLLSAYMARPDFLTSYLGDADKKTKTALMIELKAKVSRANRHRRRESKSALKKAT